MKNSANYTQTLHLTLHFADFPCDTGCIVLCSKPYTNYTQNYTLRRSKPYTKHRKEPAQEPYTEPCILFF